MKLLGVVVVVVELKGQSLKALQWWWGGRQVREEELPMKAKESQERLETR